MSARLTERARYVLMVAGTFFFIWWVWGLMAPMVVGMPK